MGRDRRAGGAVRAASPDLLLLLAVWNTNPVVPADFNGDGTVGVPDLLILLAPWGPCE